MSYGITGEDESNREIWRLIRQLEFQIGQEEDVKFVAIAAGALSRLYSHYASQVLGPAWKHTESVLTEMYADSLIESSKRVQEAV